ncbi:unnamed protein product [Calicophoron daubneyi]|uniref:GAS2-like protein 1 n=1 Tax=Calicophoron daubneyi TaxID=300641 RepID=A0AAV2THS1_CALDB
MSLAYSQWAMCSVPDKHSRATSLPPSSLLCQKHLTNFSLPLDSPDEPSNPSARNAAREWTELQCAGELRNVASISAVGRTCSPVTCYDSAKRTTKLSPSDSSVVTDEDSGYGPTTFAHHIRQTGSCSSLAYTGQLASDANSGAGIPGRDELLNVMTEDLVEWLTQMYPDLTEDLDVENFFDRLSDGVLLSYHATELHHRLSAIQGISRKGNRLYLDSLRVGGFPATLPDHCPVFQTRGLNSSNATSGFVSRDNVSNFLGWCRQLGMPDSVLFESEDLVCRKNPRNVAVCLLELARLGGNVGMSVPGLIQLEVEIDEEMAKGAGFIPQPENAGLSDRSRERQRSNASSISACTSSISTDSRTESQLAETDGTNGHNSHKEINDNSYRTTRSTELRQLRNRQKVQHAKDQKKVDENESTEDGRKKPEIKRPVVDMRSLDEIVRDLLSQCTCKQTFPMIRVSEGRYLFGDKCTQIFVRILRSHVMVRVGGGWDTLNHFLAKYDECRKTNPPNCRVPTESSKCSPEKDTSVDTSNPEEVLAAVNESSDGTMPVYPDSPIRGQGKLNVIKRSPPLENVKTTVAAKRAANPTKHPDEPFTSIDPKNSNSADISPLTSSETHSIVDEISEPISCSSPKLTRKYVHEGLSNPTQSEKSPTQSKSIHHPKSGPAAKSQRADLSHSTSSRMLTCTEADSRVTDRSGRSNTSSVLQEPKTPRRQSVPGRQSQQYATTIKQRPRIATARTPRVQRSGRSSPVRLNPKLSKSATSLLTLDSDTKQRIKSSVPGRQKPNGLGVGSEQITNVRLQENKYPSTGAVTAPFSRRLLSNGDRNSSSLARGRPTKDQLTGKMRPATVKKGPEVKRLDCGSGPGRSTETTVSADHPEPTYKPVHPALSAHGPSLIPRPIRRSSAPGIPLSEVIGLTITDLADV